MSQMKAELDERFETLKINAHEVVEWRHCLDLEVLATYAAANDTSS
jgi:hypothetical protein